MASVEHQGHWYDFIPVWYGVVAGAVTALLGGIIRVEKIANGREQDAKDIAELKAEVKGLATTTASMDAKIDILLEDRKRG